MSARGYQGPTFPFLGLIHPDVMKELMKHESCRITLSSTILRRVNILPHLENDLSNPFTYLGEDLLRIAKDCLEDKPDSNLSQMVAHRVRVKLDPVNEVKRLARYEYVGPFDSNLLLGINKDDVDPWEHLIAKEMLELIQRLGQPAVDPPVVIAPWTGESYYRNWGRVITAPVTAAKMEAVTQVQSAFKAADLASWRSVPFGLFHRKNWDLNVSDSEAAELIYKLGKVIEPEWGSDLVMPQTLIHAALASTPIAKELIANYASKSCEIKLRLEQEMDGAAARGENLAETGLFRSRPGYLPHSHQTGHALGLPSNEGFPMVLAAVDRVFKGESITLSERDSNVREALVDMLGELEQVDHRKMAEKHGIHTADDWQRFGDRIAEHRQPDPNEYSWLLYSTVVGHVWSAAAAAGDTECINGISRSRVGNLGSSAACLMPPVDLRYFKGKEHELDTKVLQGVVNHAKPREKLLVKDLLASRGPDALAEADLHPAREAVADFLVHISEGNYTEEDKHSWDFWDAADMLHLNLEDWHEYPYEFWVIMLDLWDAKSDITAPEMILTAEAALESKF